MSKLFHVLKEKIWKESIGSLFGNVEFEVPVICLGDQLFVGK